MATINGNTVNSRWFAYMNYSTSESATAMSISVQCCLQVNNYSVAYTGVTGDVSIDYGAGSNTGTISVNKSYGAGVTTYNICTANASWNKTHAAQSKAFSAGVTFPAGSSNWAGSSRAYGNLTVPAKASYAINYNANGGTGAPSAQTKWYGEDITLSSTKPTRNGYTFAGWATSASGAVAYAAGAKYTANAAVTLYAKWTANTYTVSFNANGGTGAPSAQTKTHDVTLTLSSTKPTRANYNFKGWGTSSTTTTVSYAAGAQYTANAAIILYAVWELAYTAPRITNLTVGRCDAAGTDSDSGTNAKVSFSWATDKAVSSIKINVNGKDTAITASGTSGSVSNKVVGDSGLSTESSYTLTVTVADASGSSSSSMTVAALAYIIDFDSNGNTAFGGVAQNGKDGERAVTFNKHLVVQSLSQGFYFRDCLATDGSARAKILLKSTQTNTSVASSGAVRIIGYIGGYAATNIANIDMTVYSRGASASWLRIDGYDTNTIPAGNYCKLIVRQDTAGYIYVIIQGYSYFQYNLFCIGNGFTVVDSAWATGSGVSGTDWFNSASQNTGVNHPPKLKYANGWWGMITPYGEGSWIRTTANGLIPNASGGSSSSLGTSTWPFNELWIQNLNWTTGAGSARGMIGKVLWSGSWTTGSITVSNADKYDVFGIVFSNTDANAWSTVAVRCGNQSLNMIVPSVCFINTTDQWVRVSARITISGTTFTLNALSGVGLMTNAWVLGSSQTARIRYITGIC